MKTHTILFSLFILLGLSSLSQKDTVKFHGFVNGRLMIQTGNLNQVGGGFTGNLSFGNKTFNQEIGLSYNYVKVNGFVPVNDSWNHLLFKYKPSRRVYPFVIARYGFAKSFGLKTAFTTGAGAGINIVEAKPSSFLNFNIQAGYLYFEYYDSLIINEPVIESFVAGRAKLIENRLNLDWKLMGFITPWRENTYGLMNTLRLSFKLTKTIDFTISHEMLYNEVVPIDKKRLNTTFLFGIAYRK
ncbi:MAG: DUF481 domain-containing protein [Crocinitomicaceae bacterium]|nr:DUF481 domain-containing protein [Flavobacteriales bacterium]NQZ35172.1 DUF481 domain-containing protein [Crocinitomicaceae bacterium]